MNLAEPKRGDRLTADWARALVRAVKAWRVSAGAGLRETQTPNGVVLSVAPERRAPVRERTDTSRTADEDVTQRSVEHGELGGLQARHFGTEETHAKVRGVIGDWIEADPDTGEIRAKAGAQCLELYVRVTDGTGSPESDKETKYLRLGEPAEEPTPPEDISDSEPEPPPPCGHPGNEVATSEDHPGHVADHPGDDPSADDHPAADITPESSGPCE